MVKRSRPGPLRYFLVLSLHPPYALLVLAAVVAIGVTTTVLDRKELDGGLGMVLFTQMFLASTGFVARARRGHFDPLLAGGATRGRIAAAHWAASIAPGAIAWAILAGMGAAAGAPDALSAIGGARAAALLIVSALSWAAGFWLPRGAAGMLWMALLMGLVVQRPELLAAPTGAGSVSTLILHIVSLAACPFLLLGQHPPLAPGALAGSLVLSIAAMCAVWRRAAVLDVYLLDRS